MSSYPSKKKKAFIVDIPFEFTGGEEIFYDDDVQEDDEKKKVKKEDSDDDEDVLLKRGVKFWDESLYRRGPDGRFLPKIGLASSAAALLPKTKNERKKKNAEKGFKRGYEDPFPFHAKKNYKEKLDNVLAGGDERVFAPAEIDELLAEAGGDLWKLDWDKRRRLRELQYQNPITNEPGYAEGLAAGAAQRAAELIARDPDEGRVERKLPKPKGLGDRDAGLAAGAGVGKKRRAWMRNRAESMIYTMAPENPQREYWRGVIEGANKQDRLERTIYGVRGDEAQGRDEGFDMPRDRREMQMRRVNDALARIPEGHAERPYWEGKKAGLEEAMKLPDNRDTFKVGEDVARGVGDLHHLAGQVQAEREAIADRALGGDQLPNDERMGVYWQGVQHGLDRELDLRKRGDNAFANGVAAGGEDLRIGGRARREDLIQNAYHNLRRAREDDVEARRHAEGILVGLGAPKAGVNKWDHNYKLGKQLAQNDLSFFKEDAARAHLAEAENDKNEAGIGYWAGVLDGLLGPVPPPPLTGVPDASDLPGTRRGGLTQNEWNVRAAEHRQPEDAPLLGPFKAGSAKSHGQGGINGSVIAVLETGQKVLVKPVVSQHHGRIYNQIPQGGDLPRERAAFLVIQKLGIEPNVRPVAREIDFSDQPGFENRSGLAIVQEWTDPAEPVVFSAQGWQSNVADLHKIALLDAVIGNLDRHMKNALVTPGPPKRLVPIDHGLAFPEGPDHSDKREVIRYASGNEITEGERAQLIEIASNEFAQELLDLGLSDEAVIQMRKRVRLILEKNVVPAMDELEMRQF